MIRILGNILRRIHFNWNSYTAFAQHQARKTQKLTPAIDLCIWHFKELLPKLLGLAMWPEYLAFFSTHCSSCTCKFLQTVLLNRKANNLNFRDSFIIWRPNTRIYVSFNQIEANVLKIVMSYDATIAYNIIHFIYILYILLYLGFWIKCKIKEAWYVTDSSFYPTFVQY